MLSGCGALTTGAEASRLSEKLVFTARSFTEPGLARKRSFFAISCIWLPILWKYTTWRAPIRPPYTKRSPRPSVRTVEKK